MARSEGSDVTNLLRQIVVFTERTALAVEALAEGMAEAKESTPGQPGTGLAVRNQQGTGLGIPGQDWPTYPPAHQPTFCGFQCSWAVNEAGYPETVTDDAGHTYKRREKHGATFYSRRVGESDWQYLDGLSFQAGTVLPEGAEWQYPANHAKHPANQAVVVVEE